MKYPLRKIFLQPFAYCFAFMVATSNNSFSQKSVYDVVPGSGPAKPARKKPAQSGGSVYDVVPGSGPAKPKRRRSSGGSVYDVVRGERGHHHEGRRVHRKKLPPGQAKKVYGGSATDYAPGQVKKRHHRGRHHD